MAVQRHELGEVVLACTRSIRERPTRMDQRRLDGKGTEEEVDGLRHHCLTPAGIGVVRGTRNQALAEGPERVEVVGIQEPPGGAGGRRCGHEPAEANRRDEGEQAEGSRPLEELPAPYEPVRSAPVAHSTIKA